MKKIKIIINVLLIVSVFSSCSITKRHYLPGYSIKWRTVNKMENGANSISSEPAQYVNNSNTVIDESEMPVSASTEETQIVKKTSLLYLKLKQEHDVYKTVADCDMITLQNGEENRK